MGHLSPEMLEQVLAVLGIEVPLPRNPRLETTYATAAYCRNESCFNAGGIRTRVIARGNLGESTRVHCGRCGLPNTIKIVLQS